MTSLSDPTLLEDVRRYGRFDANACMDCGSCTVSCDLSGDGDGAAFPRRTMQRTLLGLREPLHASLEPWLCHDCGDCSSACPRHAEPRESMATLRRYLATRYDFTGLSSLFHRSKFWAVFMLTFAALIVFGLFFYYHLYEVELVVDDLLTMPMGLEHMFEMIVDFTLIVAAIPVALLLISAIRMQRFTLARRGGRRIPLRFYLAEFRTMIVHTFSHENLRKCATNVANNRWGKHWLIGLACSMKLVIIVFFLSWFQTDGIYSVFHPQRWLGYFMAVVLIAFPVAILVGRIRKKDDAHTTSHMSDVTFPLMLLLVGLSGIAVHVFRYVDFPMACLFSYAFHMAFAVPLMIIELPFGKFSHALYRPMAIYFQAVKERAAEAVASQPEGEARTGVPGEAIPEGAKSS